MFYLPHQPPSSCDSTVTNQDLVSFIETPLHRIPDQLCNISVRRCAGCWSKRSCVQCGFAGFHHLNCQFDIIITRHSSQLDPANIITLGRFAYFKHR